MGRPRKLRAASPKRCFSAPAKFTSSRGASTRSSRALAASTPIGKVSCPAYEPSSDSFLFAVNGHAIVQLDSNNALDLTAGSRYTLRCGGRNFDGRGAAARFYSISALAPDGKGNVYVADYDRIRKLHLASGEVTTLPGSTPGAGVTWVGLSYDAFSDVLWAATGKAVCVVDVTAASDGGGGGGGGGGGSGGGAAVPIGGGNGSGPGGGTSPRVVAGDWQAAGYHDGDETKSRFTSIAAILAGADRCLYVLDNGMLRIVDPGNWVNTVLTGVFDGAPQCLSILPQGDLAVGHGQNIVVRGPRLGPSSPALGGRTALCPPQRQPSNRAVAGLHEALTAHAAAQDGATDTAINRPAGRLAVPGASLGAGGSERVLSAVA